LQIRGFLPLKLAIFLPVILPLLRDPAARDGKRRFDSHCTRDWHNVCFPPAEFHRRHPQPFTTHPPLPAMAQTVQQQPRPPYPPQETGPPPGVEKDMSPRPEYKAPAYKAAGKLKGLVALITGGDSGIGRSVAVLYAREGADVAFTYLPEEKDDAEETIQAVKEEGREAIAIEGDVSDPVNCQKIVDQTVRHFGKLDILVNNAAFQKHQPSIEAVSLEQWDRTFRTNIYGYYYMVRAALPQLRPGSVIINTGSITGLDGSKELLDYASTKGAIHAFTKSLAQNLVKRKIRVNCVAPGPVWTPLNPAENPKDASEFGGDTPYGRPAQPEEIAPAYVFFASNADSSYVTGEVLTLLGGDTTAG
jgi:NAD(P)-dependent dehydrogenase (short-subunit alcohol dehydrogenase family)